MLSYHDAEQGVVLWSRKVEDTADGGPGMLLWVVHTSMGMEWGRTGAAM